MLWIKYTYFKVVITQNPPFTLFMFVIRIGWFKITQYLIFWIRKRWENITHVISQHGYSRSPYYKCLLFIKFLELILFFYLSVFICIYYLFRILLKVRIVAVERMRSGVIREIEIPRRSSKVGIYVLSLHGVHARVCIRVDELDFLVREYL